MTASATRLLRPEDARRALEMRQDGWTHGDIARELGSTEGVVRRSLRDHDDALPWPPPPDDTTVWQTVWVGPAHLRERVRVRPVVLWGREVLVREGDDLVWCNPGCLEFVPASELGAVDNGHPVGLPFRDDLRLRPTAEDSPGPLEPRPPTAA